MTDKEAKEAHLEAIAEAALGGHDLDAWERTKKGWMSTCLLCGITTWVGDSGIRYSLLGDECVGRADGDMGRQQ